MVNDLFGFDRGNELIQKMATMLSMSLHKEELVGRIVADQFAILTRKSIFDDTYFMDQIQGITNIITSSYYTMTIHCGLYEVVNTEMDVSLMCDRANMAISTLRDRADNCMATYQDAMMASILHDRQVAGRLEKAVALGEFVIYLQSQVDSEGIPCGAEALVRWNDPNKGILGPGDFIDILEKTGCLYQLDQHVWELAAKQLSDWKGTVFSNLYISVNISPKDFYYVDIYKTFTGLVDRYKIDPAKLKLEITESALMKEPARQFQIINRLHNVGFQFEIDDFGSGYSSLSMLKDMPADILKIDMEFLHETENRGRSKTILDSVIKLAHELDMTVITEGVEKKSQVDFLSNMGCEIFQGYYFSKPVTVSEFEKKYRNLVKLKSKYD
jgi:EAL domain-containing protein (putative c-di-GMP-specific phosphodiesterase class I)